MRSWWLLAAIAVPLGTRAGVAQAPSVMVTAVPEFVTIAPGARQRIAVTLRIPDGWHIGWTEPGAAGLPSSLAWSDAPGFAAGAARWPAAERDSVVGGVQLVLRGTVRVVTPGRVLGSAARGVTELRGTLRWGLCSDVCYPQERTVVVSFTVGGPAERSPAFRLPGASAAPGRTDSRVRGN